MYINIYILFTYIYIYIYIYILKKEQKEYFYIRWQSMCNYCELHKLRQKRIPLTIDDRKNYKMRKKKEKEKKKKKKMKKTIIFFFTYYQCKETHSYLLLLWVFSVRSLHVQTCTLSQNFHFDRCK